MFDQEQNFHFSKAFFCSDCQKMGVYKLDSNRKFLRCSDGKTVCVCELNALYSCVVREGNWKQLASVGDVLPYDALEIIGLVISGAAFKKLAEELCSLCLMVNQEGYCYLRTAGFGETDCPVEYYRINDLFGWSEFGIQPIIRTTWNRCDMRSGGNIVNFLEQRDSFRECEKKLREMEEKLSKLTHCEKQFVEKEAELNSVKSELETARQEAADLREELEKTRPNLTPTGS